MEPSEIIEQIASLNKEIKSLIEQLVTEKEKPQIMDVDLLNQKMIGMYDLSLKLRYKLNLSEIEIDKEAADLEYFHFEPGTSRFVIEQEEPTEANDTIVDIIKPVSTEKKIEVEAVEEIKKEEPKIIKPEPIVDEVVQAVVVEDIKPTVVEVEQAVIVEVEHPQPIPETVAIPEEIVVPEVIKAIEDTIPEPVIEPIEIHEENTAADESVFDTQKIETPYWTVESGWINPIEEQKETVVIEKISVQPEPIQNSYIAPEPLIKPVPEPILNTYIAPEPVIKPVPEPIQNTYTAPEPVFKPEPEPIQNTYIAPEPVIKPEPIQSTYIAPQPSEKRPIFESITKPERSLNEMMAENKERSVINDAQKLTFTDFKSAITLNLKISFIRELFHGNEKDYKKMIDFLTKCENFSEAKMYMQDEKEKHPEWLAKQELLNHLQELINRKFV